MIRTRNPVARALALISALVLVALMSGCGETQPPTGPCTTHAIAVRHRIGSIDYWTTLCLDPRAWPVTYNVPFGVCACPGGAK